MKHELGTKNAQKNVVDLTQRETCI